MVSLKDTRRVRVINSECGVHGYSSVRGALESVSASRVSVRGV